MMNAILPAQYQQVIVNMLAFSYKYSLRVDFNIYLELLNTAVGEFLTFTHKMHNMDQSYFQ